MITTGGASCGAFMTKAAAPPFRLMGRHNPINVKS